MNSAPIVLFVGPEEGEKRAAVEEIRDAMRSRHGDGLEEHTRYAFETPAADVVHLLRSGSLFGSGTIVWYRSVESLKRKDEIEPLITYSANPNPNGVLLLESAEVSVHKGLEQAAGARNKRIFWEMFDDQKQGWLRGYFRRRKVEIDADAVELMLELVQNNTLQLKAEADRLIEFVGPRITEDDVDRYIYHAREESIFSLFDAVLALDLDHALDILQALSATSDATQIMIGLSWQMDRLYHLASIRAAGVSDAHVFDELKRATGARVVGKRVQKGLIAAVKRLTVADCEAIKVLTSDTDALLRTVPAALHRAILQQYLYAVIARRGRWNPQGRPGEPRPWEYPGAARRRAFA